MIRRFSLLVGGLVQKLIDFFATPVEISEEEMKKATIEMLERIASDKKQNKLNKEK